MISNESLMSLLRSPCCKQELSVLQISLTCRQCGKKYPVVDGTPVMIDEERSVFRIAGLAREDHFSDKRESVIRWMKGVLPGSTMNLRADERFARAVELLRSKKRVCRGLVIGGASLGIGLMRLLNEQSLELIETDVRLGARTELLCDAHDLPFEDSSIDIVIAQAMLEHVLDPHRCVAEMHRVLRADGLAYAETPFMQQVHEGRFDFTRFTHLGHRRLFRHFEEIESGAVAGPGSSAAWAYEHLWLSFARGRRSWTVLKLIGRLSGFWFKYLDLIAPQRSGVFDCASGFYFLGRKAERPISDREIIEGYRGLQRWI